MNSETRLTVSGYVVDIACLRRYPESEYAQRARAHSKECALMGHCVESGYAVVDDDGVAHLLDTHATPQVVDTLERSTKDTGIYLQVQRRADDGEMTTEVVDEQRRDAAVPGSEEDEFGNTVNPPGPPGGDPGRSDTSPAPSPERDEDASAEAQRSGCSANAD